MPTYTVADVVDIIKTFTAEQKAALKEQLEAVLEIIETTPPANGKQQEVSQTFGNISVDMAGGTGSRFDIGNNNQIQANGNASIREQQVQAMATANETDSLKMALQILEQLKQNVEQTESLNRLDKKQAQGMLEVVEEELQQEQPDKGLVEQAIDSLKTAFQGIKELAEPTIKIAGLVATAWGL